MLQTRIEQSSKKITAKFPETPPPRKFQGPIAVYGAPLRENDEIERFLFVRFRALQFVEKGARVTWIGFLHQFS